ncbi:MAG: mechanosensitive ion channel [Proteobacteria bacterium]|nr:mechanosensitive ion channel [Pseudomonadota bacterium]
MNLELLAPHVPSLLAMAAVVLTVSTVHKLIRGRKTSEQSQDHLREQLLLLALWLSGIVSLIVVLPVAEDTRNQLLGLFGLLLSAAIGLASTTFVGNAMAGLMLKGLRNMNPGDFIEVGGHFGRISDRGLFHTEIQTEDRDLVTLPNLFLVTQPTRVVRNSGTVVAGEVSLGYDVSRTRVEARLLEAAADVRLKDPFVQLKALGDFSISWRVGGIQTDVKQMVSSHSRLRKAMLDRLHGDGIEIVSPVYEVGKTVAADAAPVIADSNDVVHIPEGKAVEAIVFDKADIAESLERMQAKKTAISKDIEGLKAQQKVADDPVAVSEFGRKIERKEALLAAAGRAIEERERRKSED